jgi:hypothetical protein
MEVTLAVLCHEVRSSPQGMDLIGCFRSIEPRQLPARMFPFRLYAELVFEAGELETDHHVAIQLIDPDGMIYGQPHEREYRPPSQDGRSRILQSTSHYRGLVFHKHGHHVFEFLHNGKLVKRLLLNVVAP